MCWLLVCRRLSDLNPEEGILFSPRAISYKQKKEEYKYPAPQTEEATTQYGSHPQGVCETVKS